MARRKSRRTYVKGKPNYLWVSTAGTFALMMDSTASDAVLVPDDWSGTVTEGTCTLLRMVLSVYTMTSSAEEIPHAENACVVLGNASEAATYSTNDISNWNEWPDFFAAYDRVLRIFRLEWDGNGLPSGSGLNVQFSQLPEPVMNLKTPRILKGDDSVRICVGGNFAQSVQESPEVMWFARSLVRVGLR